MVQPVDDEGNDVEHRDYNSRRIAAGRSGSAANPVLASEGITGQHIMSTVIIEHVKVGDLPESWRERLAKPSDTRVTVRIEEETAREDGEASQLDTREDIEDPAFGIWRDRDDLADVDAYLRKIRAPRHGNGSRNES